MGDIAGMNSGTLHVNLTNYYIFLVWAKAKKSSNGVRF